MKYLFLLIPFYTFAQCPGDNCNDPQILSAPATNEVVCAETVCNGDWPVWNCTDEQDGEPGLCWSQEYDYFIQLQVEQEGVYYFHLMSNYQAPPTAPPGIDGGVQMAIYNNDVCAIWMSPIAITPCSGDPGSQSQEYFMDVYLEPDNYIIQIDGFGFSYGCSTLCVYGKFFTDLGIPVHYYELKKSINEFDLIGRRY